MINDRYIRSMERYSRPSVDPMVQSEIAEIKEAIKILFYGIKVDYENDLSRLGEIINKWENK